jgi:phage terminase large subunit
MAWVKVGLKDKEFYILDEIYENHISAEELVERLKDHEMLIGKDIESDHDKERQIILKKHGFNSINADKSGKKSDRIKLIKNYKIHVHPRCENFLYEISLYKWKKDRETGKYKDEPIEIFDHLMDAFSYAVIKYIKQADLGASNKIGISKNRKQNVYKSRRGR